jgi:hypothetical protein
MSEESLKGDGMWNTKERPPLSIGSTTRNAILNKWVLISGVLENEVWVD